jgi:RND family efflux transporter MFP subunit
LFARRFLLASSVKKITLCSLLLSTCGISGFWLFNSLKPQKTDASNSLCLTATPNSITEVININGLINPSISVNLTSDKTGMISKLYVKEGDFVKKGQLVASLDSKDIDVQIRNKNEELKALRQKYQTLEKRANRMILLARQGILPLIDREESEAEIFDNRANIARLESELILLLRDRARSLITSPFDGTVAQIFAFPGTFVSPMTSASESDQSTKSTIMQIYSHLQVVINSPEAIVFDILQSKEITVSPTTDTRIKIPAKIDRVMPYVILTKDKVNAIPVRIDIADPRPFLPGMDVEISIVKSPLSGLGVKTYAIVRKNRRNGLLACNASLDFSEVQVLGESGGTTIVQPGKFVKPGFRYSVVGSTQKSPGIFDFFGKEGLKKLKEGMDLNPLK